MSRLTVITDRALERALDLAHSAGDGIKHAGGNLGGSLRHFGPTDADWLKTGAALGAVLAEQAAAAKSTASGGK
ncbi:MAG: hypothetical protein JHC82_05490 [Stenotrophomonas sp.]|nr:hypothetical protein [Stenotrophomonas sp.]